MSFSRWLAWNKMQTASSRIWTLVADSISLKDDHYAKDASKILSMLDCILCLLYSSAIYFISIREYWVYNHKQVTAIN